MTEIEEILNKCLLGPVINISDLLHMVLTEQMTWGIWPFEHACSESVRKSFYIPSQRGTLEVGGGGKGGGVELMLDL